MKNDFREKIEELLIENSVWSLYDEEAKPGDRIVNATITSGKEVVEGVLKLHNKRLKEVLEELKNEAVKEQNKKIDEVLESLE